MQTHKHRYTHSYGRFSPPINPFNVVTISHSDLIIFVKTRKNSHRKLMKPQFLSLCVYMNLYVHVHSTIARLSLCLIMCVLSCEGVLYVRACALSMCLSVGVLLSKFSKAAVETCVTWTLIGQMQWQLRLPNWNTKQRTPTVISGGQAVTERWQ